MEIQLVHSSVLTVPHFAKNTLSGVKTVILCETSDVNDAHNFMFNFMEKVKQCLPMLDSDDKLTCYCYMSDRKLNTRKLYGNLREYLEKHPNQEIIKNNNSWQH
jgi:hypothetical protein